MITKFKAGRTTIHRIVEQEAVAVFDMLKFFPGLTPELLAENSGWLKPRYVDEAGRIVLCIQSYLVETPHHRILIDTCVGNHKPRPTRPFWNMMTSDRYERNLAAAGFGVEDIDFVMCTHLHVDHTGWNTRLENGRWVPTFPNARYLFADRELDYWMKRQTADPDSCPWVEDSVLPIVAAGRADIVKSSHQFDDLVMLVPTPGHTIDHFSVHVGKSGDDAFITGDMVHSPIQVRHPELAMMSDHDGAQGAETRRRIFGQFCGTPTRICTVHFASPSTGRIVRHGDAFDFVGD
ncbi:MAG TPA: MBL fold metallo-hydrolase [Pseudorhodoplanes sp.]|jgi:glyoxylase-like metal-dependent hydrolase (beta-lactamase superfamily II)|nr:MBL fold metallo-hydrolase [Pseudorhodoplanes sp.]